MTRRVVIDSHGGPARMRLEGVEVPAPGPGEVQIEQTAVGLNYIDVYQRSGHYPLSLPSPLGLEAAGRVVAVGKGVEGDMSVGDRVVYVGLLGAYAELRNAPAERVLPIPDGVTDDEAAGVLLKGMTTEYLLERVYRVKQGDDVLFWAASGGVGQIAGQWGKHLGARMIGVTAGPDNVALVKDRGYATALDRRTDDIAARVRDLTGGQGVPVVYDSVGLASFDASINSLARCGMFVSFGATTGPVPEVSPHLLQEKGSLFFTRPSLAHYVHAREDLMRSANRVFELMKSGALKVHIGQKFPLSEVAAAHRALESGTTTGSTILVP